MEKDYLIFKCASRPSGQWKDDDFDVLADGVVVGRYRMMLLARADRRTLALSTWRKKRRELEMSDQAPLLIGKRLAV